MRGVTDRRYLLPADVDLVPAEEGQTLVVRRGSRYPPQLLSADAADLIGYFRRPTTVVDAILGYSAHAGRDPLRTLEESFGVLVGLSRTDVLVAEERAAADPVCARYGIGDRVGPAVLRGQIRVLRDGEIWRGQLEEGGCPVVVKVVDEAAHGAGLFARELAALQLLHDAPTPNVVWSEAAATGGVLVLVEAVGDPVDLQAMTVDEHTRRQLVAAVLDAYARLHARGVLHGDVHPGNVLVSDTAAVTVIDFGLAALPSSASAPRGAGGEYLDPQAAAALAADAPMPAYDAAAEQYALAAMSVRLLTGSAYLDLTCERREALRRIVEAPPSLDDLWARWPQGARVLRRALAKDPVGRFASVSLLASAFRAALLSRPVQPSGGSVAVECAEFEVDAPAWSAADPDQIRVVAARLAGLAAASGDVAAYDLACVWSARLAT